jgi:hypothetical protein
LLTAAEVRVLSVRGVGIPATRELALELGTIAERTVKQDIILQNLSTEVWECKSIISGDFTFSALPLIAVQPQSSTPMTVIFASAIVRNCAGEMTCVNLNGKINRCIHIFGNCGQTARGGEDRRSSSGAGTDKMVDTILVSPLRAMKRLFAVYFYFDNDGEFWCAIRIDIEEALAVSTTLIALENPTACAATFTSRMTTHQSSRS